MFTLKTMLFVVFSFALTAASINQIASAPIGAKEVKLEIMTNRRVGRTDQRTARPTDGQTG